DLGEIGIATVLGDARHVVEKLLLGIGAEVGARDFLFRKVRDQPLEVVYAAVGDAQQAGGEARIAASFFLGSSFQNQDSIAVLPGCEGRAKGRVAAADHDDVVHQSALMCCKSGGVPATPTCVRPATRSITMGPVPLYGTCWRSMPPVASFRYSMARWPALAFPAEP